MRRLAVDDDFNLVPVLRFVELEVFVRPGDEVIAALQLRGADKDAAVGIDPGAKFQTQDKVRGELAHGPQLPNGLGAAVAVVGGHDAIGHREAVVGAGGVAGCGRG